jgi:hypothetical protein
MFGVLYNHSRTLRTVNISVSVGVAFGASAGGLGCRLSGRLCCRFSGNKVCAVNLAASMGVTFLQ